MARRRADLVVVEQGIAPSRSKAQALIMAGAVVTEQGTVVRKAGELLGPHSVLRLKAEPMPYVSRGGLKLAAALDQFGVDPCGRTCLDVGASTGGFTDCLLQRGAGRVFAVDVGYGQLAWKIRQNPRVVVIERANIRTLSPRRIPEPVSLVVVDVSFISLRLVVPAAMKLAAEEAELVALVKPQFEVGRGEVGKGGIVRDSEKQQRALQDVKAALLAFGLGALRTMESPIQGAKGNREFLLAGKVATQ